MKTKNIFRMLLVAAALLLGANNVKAQDTHKIEYEIYGQGTVTASKTEAIEGETITFTVTPAEGYSVKNVIVRNDWYQNIEVTDNTFIMPGRDVKIVVTFEANTYSITATAGDNGSINVATSATFGSEVTMYIQPNWQYEIDELTVTGEDGTPITVTNNKFTMPAQNVTINVTFKATTTITYNIWNGNNIQNGSVSANPSTAEEGATITLSSNPNTGYELDYYSISTDNSTFEAIEGNQFTMPARNVWVSATFKLANYTVTINEPTNGTVTADNTTDVHYGDKVTLTITPAENYELDVLSVKDASNNDVTVTNNEFTMPASNVTITATFKNSESEPVAPTAPADIENEHSLWTGSVKAESGDGHLTETISASLFANIKAGDSFRVYVTDINTSQNWKLYITNSASGWATQVFEDFNGGDITNANVGSALHNEDGYSYFEFTCSETTASSFKANGTQMSFTWMTVLKVSYISNESVESESYDIIVSSTTNGTVTASAESATQGTEVTLTITPADNYELDNISAVDASNNAVTLNGNGNTRTFTMPASNVTVSATFKATEATTYSISVSTQGNGSATVSESEAEAGTTIYITTRPSNGYEVESVYASGASVTQSTANRYYFTMPASDVTVTVTFTAIQQGNSNYVTATIGSTGYATFSSSSALDFSGLTDVEAFYASSQSGSIVYLTQITGTVEAYTGMIIRGSAGTYYIPKTSSGSSYDNLLVAGNGTELSYSTSEDDYFVLVERSGSPVFVQIYDDPATVYLGQAYLSLSKNRARARSLSIKFGNGEGTTGISGIENETTGDNVIYNLSGQRVEKPTKGLYIINGKKVLIK